MAQVKNQAEFDVQLPSFVDDIVDWEGNINIVEVEANVKRIVREVVEDCKLLLETDKEEILHLRKSRKKKNADRKLA